MVVQSSILQTRLKERDNQLKGAMRSFFGSVSDNAARTYLANPESLRAAIEKELKRARESANVLGLNASSPLVLMKNLSSSVGKDTVVDLMSFQLGAATAQAAGSGGRAEAPIELVFVSTEQAAAEKLAARIAPKLIDAPKPTVEEIAASGKEPRKFRITFRGNATPGGFRNE